MSRHGTGESDYERYIRTDELLSLQKKTTSLANHEELFFQCIHQAMELWFKVAGFELEKIARFVDGDDLERGAWHLRRTAHMLDHVGDGLPLLETLAPADYHEIRLALGRGSGQDSPGFKLILDELPRLWAPFERTLDRHGVTLLAVFQTPHAPTHQGLFRVAQGYLQLDEAFQRFRYDHLQLARREIGLAVKSLKGVPARNLEQGVLKPAYPALWTVIEELTISTNPVYG
ncbi:MAG: tryptophan 2,3-dioxygenase family protein [Deltaproteobacteria bacterium]|nr:tryptophan 2,3-dioxygenase family protein [Deltaproteobacteria bacterium]